MPSLPGDPDTTWANVGVLAGRSGRPGVAPVGRQEYPRRLLQLCAVADDGLAGWYRTAGVIFRVHFVR
jgi:hypothetical protein